MGRIVDLTLPRLGETMDAGTITAWLKAPGDPFKRGEVILEVETDKTVVEVPALQDGVLVEILEGAESAVAVDAPIARIEVKADVPKTEKVGQKAEAPVTSIAPAVRHPVAPTSGVRASPRARRMARDGGIDLTTVVGTGRNGRIMATDLAASNAPTAQKGTLAWHEWPAVGAARGSILLLHGLFADGTSFEALARALARMGYAVAAPDLPGHGESAVVAGGFDSVLDNLAGETKTMADHVIGHSAGAALAARLAARGVVAAKSLTLLAPLGCGTRIDQEFLTGLVEARTPAALERQLSKLGAPSLSADRRDALLSAIATSRAGLRTLVDDVAQDGVQQIDCLGDLAGLDCPVTAIFGGEDRIVPHTHALNLPANVASHIVAGAGHVPHLTASQTVAAIIARTMRQA